MTDTFPQDRFLRKDPDQNDETKSAVYTAANPAPKRSDDSMRKAGRPSGNEEDSGAKNVLTGTVIVSCFIQTSALPSRIEMQGNDLTFFDDTVSKNGEIQGDTSRLIFTHASAKKGDVISSGFILQKRALIGDTYDNVLELFSPDNSPNSNYIFLGRMGTGEERNVRDIDVNVNHVTATGNSEGFTNGVFRVRVSRNGADADLRDGVYIIDRASVDSSSNDGSLCWLVGGGPNGQVRLSYIPNRSDNPSGAAIELQVGAVGVRIFGLPTSAAGLPTHTLWNNGGVLNIT